MCFSECDVLPARQSSSPGAAVPSFKDSSGEDFCVCFSFVLHEQIAATIDAQQIEKKSPKAPPGLRNNAKINPEMVPGATFFAA